MTKRRSLLEEERIRYQPVIPGFLQDLPAITAKELSLRKIPEGIRALFPKTYGLTPVRFEKGESAAKKEPLRVGVLFSGGQAPGGHNVVLGLFEGIRKFNAHSVLIGFLGGPSGVIENKSIEITNALLAPYRNTGGFDLLGSGRTKIETESQFEATLHTVQAHHLSGLVIIGGDDSNTNAALLAEYFLAKGCKTKVIGVPKTIDGDLKNEAIEVSFGFDTACKVYSELIGNIARDAISAKKYYHFIKLMGRSASHVALECALQVHPNFALIGEEIASQKRRLKEIAKEIADLIIERAALGKNYGLILVPEGLVEFVPEMKLLIQELNEKLAQHTPEEALGQLSKEAKETFASLPEKIQRQLLLDRDPHGNVQVSMIATEELLIEMVRRELKAASNFKGKFSAVAHFLGYEGRAAFPSNFDANYTYALGAVAASLIALGFSGYMATLADLTHPPHEWRGGGTPFVSMMQMEERKGKSVPVIAKSLVNLEGQPFTTFEKERKEWRLEDSYMYPGPIQFAGTPALVDATTITLQLEAWSL